MIDTILNLLFGCSHRHLTRPITPVTKDGKGDGHTYVVCLDCTKQFVYDLKEMRIGREIKRAPGIGVLAPTAPVARKTKLKYTMAVALPLGVLLGSALQRRKGKQDRR